MITDETYRQVKSMLRNDTSKTTDSMYNILIKNYFKEDKTDWYEEKDGEKNWVEKKKIIDFWSLIRKLIIPIGKKEKVFDFSSFIFPPEEFAHNGRFGNKGFIPAKNFWENVNDIKAFEFKVKFTDAKFLGNFNISGVEFWEDVDFSNAEFLEDVFIDRKSNFSREVKFENVTFQKHVFFKCHFAYKTSFYQSIFKKLANFEECVFLLQTNFENVNFEQDANFNSTYFGLISNFSGATFNGLTTFLDTKFKNDVDFSDSEFKGDTNFYRTKFEKTANFENSIFLGDKKFFFLDLEGDNLKLNFKNTIFSKSILFRRINFTNTTFLESDLTDVKFRECEWEDNSRIILHDEKEVDKKDKNQLKSLEVLYRQLKKNFETTKNWELSGKAYVSEMEMRKRRLWLERNYYQWFIYKFYDVFGGYTQDFRKPIFSLVGLILVFSGLYFFIDYDILKAFQRGIKGALPYMQIDVENPFKGYWLILRNLELVLGGTFLAFFILALRKRFKQ